MDLTVEDGEAVRSFYADVVGWTSESVDMGGYSDYNMCRPDDGAPVAGVCWARGGNEGLPPVWTLYVNVADLDASLVACEAGGGTIVRAVRSMGALGRYALIRDPAGAVLALFEHADA